MEYIILINYSYISLAKIVNEHINEGYKPQGGVTYSQGNYLQAMVK